MGYTTEFKGSLSLSRTLTDEEKNYINTFSETRRMGRDSEKLFEKFGGANGKILNDGEPKTAQNCYGYNGEFYVGDDNLFVYDYNSHSNQPSLWCQWIIEDNELTWDGGEKFYYYVDWLNYLIENFFKYWGVVLNGTIKWRGEDFDDNGIITVCDNLVLTQTL